MNSDDLLRENQALRDRLSRLSEASLRITEDLEPTAVLQGVVDGARALTGANTAGITALDERGQLWEFVTSGLTRRSTGWWWSCPAGCSSSPTWANCQSRCGWPTSQRIRSGRLGLPDIGPPLGPVGAFLRMPIRLLGRHVGDLYLAGKGGSRLQARTAGRSLKTTR